FQGAVGVSSMIGLVSPDYLVLRPNEGFNARYLHHLLRSHWFVGKMASRLRGIGGIETGYVRTPRINVSDLDEIVVDFPSLQQQRAIADFLDRGTAQIDSLVEKQKSLIETLRERRAAIIERLTSEGSENAP